MYVRKYPLRFCFIFFSLIGCLVFFAINLILIQTFRSSFLAALAEKQHNYVVELEPTRGSVLDRELRPLAINVPVYSIFANPRIMSAQDKAKAVQALSGALKIDAHFLTERLNKRKYFVWLARKIPLEIADKVKGLKIKGLDFISESRRYYPNGSLAAHLIGFAGVDNEGLEGIELFYNNVLRGEFGYKKLLRDAKQDELMIGDQMKMPKDGFHLVLTIDETIQYIAERALDEAYRKHHAKAATIIVMDIKTGEILALANRPTYNLTEASQSDEEQRTNRAISYVYEPGSVFKIVTASAALEENAFTETDKIFCENGAYKVANHILHDHQSHGILTFRQVFEESSNIGVTKIAQKLGPEAIYKYAQKFRFGMKTNIDLLGEVKGVLKPPLLWSKTSIGAIPIGQEVLVTPLQLVSAIAAVANGGVYMRPFVVKYIVDNNDQIVQTFEPQAVDKVINEETAGRVTEILVGVVEEGTGKNARIKGVRVAGKTGTAQKVINGIYSHDQFYASFIGFAPADNPRLAAIVVVDDPHPSYFGGTVAAPVFKEVIENALHYLDNLKRSGTLTFAH